MSQPPKSKEDKRIAALNSYKILDTLAETSYDDLTFVASQICDTPISLVSLVDKDRQWFKSRVGLEASETPRNIAFCTHAIEGNDVFIVEDASRDARFKANPLVNGDPNIRFYAGAPLVTKEGFGLGTLCVIDRVPRILTEKKIRALEALSRQVVALLEFRKVAAELEQALNEVKMLNDMLPMCAWCRKVRNDEGFWTKVEDYLKDKSGVTTSHGICPECVKIEKEKIRKINF
ncbi:MAG: GAF domain-containing protein [Proteobacteria bacterium]|nr:GAF domain-containing protein [Pseudomonadota bacterium]